MCIFIAISSMSLYLGISLASIILGSEHWSICYGKQTIALCIYESIPLTDISMKPVKKNCLNATQKSLQITSQRLYKSKTWLSFPLFVSMQSPLALTRFTQVFRKSRNYIKSKFLRPVTFMKFLLATKHVEWSEEGWALSEKLRTYSVPSATQQNSGHASARHSGSNAFKNHQICITHNVKNANLENVDFFMRLRSYGNSEKTCGTKDD